MKRFLFSLFLVVITAFGYAQPSSKESDDVVFVSHVVEEGETMILIAKQYLVWPSVIYENNKIVVDGVEPGMILNIPVARKKLGGFTNVPIFLDDKINDMLAYQNCVPIYINRDVYFDAAVMNNVYLLKNGLKKFNVLKISNKKIENAVVFVPKTSQNLVYKDKKIETPIKEIIAAVEIEKPKEIVAVVAVKKPVITSEKIEKVAIIPEKIQKPAVVAVAAYTTPASKHTVEAKETLFKLTQKYDVVIEDLLAANEEAQLLNGLKIGQVINIPAATHNVNPETIVASSTPIEKAFVVDNTSTKHTVEAKETMYSMSKKFNVSIVDLAKANETLLADGVKIGQILTIPRNITTIAAVETKKEVTKKAVDPNAIVHIVEQKETLYSVSKKYGITVEDLSKFNEETLKEGMKIGQELLIPKSAIIKNTDTVVAVEKTVIDDAPEKSPYAIHIVKEGESLFTIARKYNVYMDDMRMINDEKFLDNLIVGKEVKIPNKKEDEYEPFETFGD